VLYFNKMLKLCTTLVYFKIFCIFTSQPIQHMQQEDYKNEHSRLEGQILRLQSELRESKAKYIKDYSEFQLDEKVIICTPTHTNSHGQVPCSERFAYIHEVSLDYIADFRYELKQAKKNGKKSRNNEWLHTHNYVEYLKKI